MKKGFFKRIILWAVLLLIAAAIIYYSAEVVSARSKTPELVADILASGKIDMTAEDLTAEQKEILIRVEDPNFYGHHGVDFATPGAGWTTITQGLAKKLYFNDFEQGLMKIKQTLCAWLALDPLVDKDTQLTLYINLMYFGNDVQGLHDAAKYYYGKAVSDLTEDEYISLIACLISPTELNVKSHPEENAKRVARIRKVLSGEYTPQGLFDITYEGAD